MDLRIRGATPPDPFLSAADLLSTEHDLDSPVEVQVRDDPDERTWAAHYDDRHVLNISGKAATSAMARELALHELAHMARYEQGHASHTQSTDEALFLALSGRDVERRKLTHCYQIANHMRDIYADDITLSVAPAAKLVPFLESQLATAVAAAPDREATRHPEERRISVTADPDITAVNAAFAIGLVERHDLVDDDHRLYDLARAAATDAPGVGMETFKRLFRTLADDPTESDFRRDLVTATRAYALDGEGGRAAD
ncbi:DUF5781 family protein [Haloplanus salilacus]|uniref:DUF5781 family protein n=1 Tax=Haloplanus salilacus TaxID=2949994 RepID=UPI0030D2B300